MIVARLITCYIIWTLRYGIPPWRYFQLNATFFNAKKGIYSKLELDQYIPKKWRLNQIYLTDKTPPNHYPVFLKPEWGQNSYGIKLVHSLAEFKQACMQLQDHPVPYIVQSLAKGKIEYELFYIQDSEQKQNIATLTITQVVNNAQKNPINAINNKHTSYRDITLEFSQIEIQMLKIHLAELPNFRFARVAIKADNKDDLLAGNFSIIEINLFAPMPLNLLDVSHNKPHIINFIRINMQLLAKLSSKIPKEDFKPFIFWKKVRLHYQIQ